MNNKFNSDYIGKDQNATNEYRDIPLGLGMSLAQHTDALNYFGTLDESQRNKIINYVQGATTGPDAKQRVNTAVEMLQQHDVDFVQ